MALVPEEREEAPAVALERRAAGREAALAVALLGRALRPGLSQLAARAMVHQAALVVALERRAPPPAPHLGQAQAVKPLAAKALTLEQDPAAE